MITHETEVPSQPIQVEGEQEVDKQILVGPRDGYPGFLREFTLAAGVHTPYHHHDWYHVVYMLEGTGNVRYGEEEHDIRQGSVLFVEPGRPHGFVKTGTTQMRFLCLVPETADEYSEAH